MKVDTLTVPRESVRYISRLHNNSNLGIHSPGPQYSIPEGNRNSVVIASKPSPKLFISKEHCKEMRGRDSPGPGTSSPNYEVGETSPNHSFTSADRFPKDNSPVRKPLMMPSSIGNQVLSTHTSRAIHGFPKNERFRNVTFVSREHAVSNSGQESPGPYLHPQHQYASPNPPSYSFPRSPTKEVTKMPHISKLHSSVVSYGHESPGAIYNTDVFNTHDAHSSKRQPRRKRNFFQPSIDRARAVLERTRKIQETAEPTPDKKTVSPPKKTSYFSDDLSATSKNGPAYSFGGETDASKAKRYLSPLHAACDHRGSDSPGPRYGLQDSIANKTRFSFGGRIPPHEDIRSPGPAQYNTRSNISRESPSYSIAKEGLSQGYTKVFAVPKRARLMGGKLDDENFGVFSPPCRYNPRDSMGSGGFTFSRSERSRNLFGQSNYSIGDEDDEFGTTTTLGQSRLITHSMRRDEADEYIPRERETISAQEDRQPERSKGWSFGTSERKSRRNADYQDPARIQLYSDLHAIENLGRGSPGPVAQHVKDPSETTLSGPKHRFGTASRFGGERMDITPGPDYMVSQKALSTMKRSPEHSMGERGM